MAQNVKSTHDIAYWRQSIQRRISQVLADNQAVIQSPVDHPYLLDGPDVLVAFSGKLLALFVASRDESISPDRFEQRVKLSFAALPAHTIFLNGSDLDLLPNINGVFVEALPSLSLYSKGKRSHDGPVEVRADVIRSVARHTRQVSEDDIRERARLYKRFFIYDAVSRLNLRKLKPPRQSDSLADKHRIERTTIEQTAKLAESMIAERTARIVKSRPSDLRRLIYNPKATDDWIVVDDGRVYAQRDAPGILVTEDFPTNSTDPDKYARAITFAGWVPADSDWDLARVERGLNLVKGRIRGKAR